MSYRLGKMIKQQHDSPVMPPAHIKEAIMTAVKNAPFSVKRNYNLRYAVGLATILVMGAGGTVFAAQQATPKDILYPVKRASETAYINIQSSPTARADAQEQIIDRRFDEAEKVADADDVNATVDADNDKIEDQLANDAASESDAWVNAQEQSFSNDIQLASSGN